MKLSCDGSYHVMASTKQSCVCKNKIYLLTPFMAIFPSPSKFICCIHMYLGASITPHTYTRGKAISFVIVVVVDTKITNFGNLGSCKCSRSVEFGKF